MENIVDKLTNYKYSLKEKIIGLKSKSISGTNVISLSDASGSNAIAFGTKGNSIQNGEPTPDTPIGIENISESVEIKNVNKNFLNEPSVYKLYQYEFNKPLLLKAGTYILSADKIETNGANKSLINFKNVDGVNKSTYLSSTALSTTVTFEKDIVSYSSFSQNNYDNSAGITTTFTNLMLRKSTDDDSYAEHKESIVTFPLAEGQKLYKDTYLADDGIHHKRKQFILPNNTGGYNSDFNWYYLSFSALGISIKPTTLLSNYFKYYTSQDFAYNNKTDEGISLQSTHILIRVDGLSSQEEYRNWLSEHNVIVEHETKEEEIVPYTEEQQVAYNKLKTFAMFKGVNNIEVSSSIEVSETSIEYYSDEVVSLDNYKFEVKEI